MSKILIQKKGITHFNVDCIINAANSSLAYGGGVCGAIFEAAGLMNYLLLAIILNIVIPVIQ